MFGSLLWFILPSVCIQTVHVIGHATSEGTDTKHLIGPKIDVLDTWLTVEMMFSWREYLRSRMNFLCVRVCVRECTLTRRSAPLVACWNMTWRCCFIAFTKAAATPTASQESRVSAHNTCHSLLTNALLRGVASYGTHHSRYSYPTGMQSLGSGTDHRVMMESQSASYLPCNPAHMSLPF